ncbi:IucA/IucC family protein [Embleya sp. NPDC059259]|uniref:IucA/IucC family protein n=1 Tax=unclassified Embleya TaxID=2699296 RepID=UPI00369F33FF
MFHTIGERLLADQLRTASPDRLGAYEAALPGARAAVLSRLWRGLVHDRLPWVVRHERAGDAVVLHLADGRRAHGPAPDPWDTRPSTTVVVLAGTAYHHPARLVRALRVPHGPEFAVELDNSTASLALSRTTPTPRDPPGSDWEWEQRVVDGHPYHPGCRSRPGFTAGEQLAYAPEHRPVVQLGLAATADALVVGDWPAHLREGRTVLVPVHPWQARHVLPDTPVRPGFPAHPLMSLRTLAPLAGGPHVKTALSARLTSSVRDISEHSVAHSVAVSAFLDRLARRLDGRLHITRTLAAASAGTADLAAVLRESPGAHADHEAGERVLPAAAFAGSPAAVLAFARLAGSVCLDLLDLGVALEAHGQNLLVIVDRAGDPVRLVYRDIADVRISPARLRRHRIAPPPLTGRPVTDDAGELRRKLFGSLITGTLGPLAGNAHTMRELLAALTRDLAHTDDVEALSTRPLPTKALTGMRLNPGRPGDAWTEVPNPLVGGIG